DKVADGERYGELLRIFGDGLRAAPISCAIGVVGAVQVVEEAGVVDVPAKAETSAAGKRAVCAKKNPAFEVPGDAAYRFGVFVVLVFFGVFLCRSGGQRLNAKRQENKAHLRDAAALHLSARIRKEILPTV